MAELKRCEDCRWFKSGWLEDIRFGKCVSPHNFTHPVSRSVTDMRYAVDNRRCSDRCGEVARWFEAKPERIPGWSFRLTFDWRHHE